MCGVQLLAYPEDIFPVNIHIHCPLPLSLYVCCCLKETKYFGADHYVLETHAMAAKWQAAAELFCCGEEVLSRASGTLLLQATATKPTDVVTMNQHEDLDKQGQQLLLAFIGFWYLQCQHQHSSASNPVSLQDLYEANSHPIAENRSSFAHYINMQMLSPHLTDSMLSGHSGKVQQPHSLILSAALVTKLASLASAVKADEYKETLLALWDTVIQISFKLDEHYTTCQLVHTDSSSNDLGTEQELTLSVDLVRLVMSSLRQSFQGVDVGSVACCKVLDAMLRNQNPRVQEPVFQEILRLGEVV